MHTSTHPTSSPAPAPTVTRQLAVPSDVGTHPPLPPRAAMLPRPTQHVKAPVPRCECTGQLIPWAVVHPRPLKRLQLPVLRGECTSPRPPRAAVLLGPSQQLNGLDKVLQLERHPDGPARLVQEGAGGRRGVTYPRRAGAASSRWRVAARRRGRGRGQSAVGGGVGDI